MKTLKTRSSACPRSSQRRVGSRLPSVSLWTALVLALLGAGNAYADTVADRLEEYRAAGAGPFSAESGLTLWQQAFVTAGEPRACTRCHTADPRKPGKHATTGKPIEPLAPSVNPKRLTDRREIEKWFTRNCKWTLGRECTAQEKGDLLTFLTSR